MIEFSVPQNKKIIFDSLGEYDFLRPDFRANLIFRGELFPSAEHAYQAAKDWDNLEWRNKILSIHSPTDVRSFGKQKSSLTWEKEKLKILEEVQFAKFNSNFQLKLRLLLTTGYVLSPSEIPEELAIISKDKKIDLGEILMSVREKIEKNEGNYFQLLLRFLHSHGIGFMEPWLATK
jgi:predicted NAD-dependent protein-ADP-ribosyltransferase YbiA (DUF1768 family)